MRIIAKRTLREFWEAHLDAEHALLDWHDLVAEKDWSNPNEVKETWRNASIIESNRVIFNIKGNDYRLITEIDFVHKFVFIIWIGSHSDYDRIDAKKIEFKRK